jgi:flagellar L-ring protein FlgH
MRRLLAAVLLLSWLVAAVGWADSLYTPTSSFGRLFGDRKATRIGDVLHIIITETSQASQNMADTSGASTDATIGPGTGKLGFLPLWGYTGSTSAKAQGTTSRSGSIVGRIAVTVIGLSPSGNLLVEGERVVVVHKDSQIIKIQGEIRPQDVAADSTVPSYKVANARISYTGSDPLRPGSKVGIITRLLHYLF